MFFLVFSQESSSSSSRNIKSISIPKSYIADPFTCDSVVTVYTTIQPRTTMSDGMGQQVVRTPSIYHYYYFLKYLKCTLYNIQQYDIASKQNVWVKVCLLSILQSSYAYILYHWWLLHILATVVLRSTYKLIVIVPISRHTLLPAPHGVRPHLGFTGFPTTHFCQHTNKSRFADYRHN